jgi:hypothetical protein
MGRGPVWEWLLARPFLPGACAPGSVSGISGPFEPLSRSPRWVTHVLLTRPPLTVRVSPNGSLDLHVLGTPPAFALSQDQTLREILKPRRAFVDYGAGSFRIRILKLRSVRALFSFQRAGVRAADSSSARSGVSTPWRGISFPLIVPLTLLYAVAVGGTSVGSPTPTFLF